RFSRDWSSDVCFPICALDHAVDLGFDQMRGATRGQQRRDSARPDDVADLLEPEIFTHAERRADAPEEPGVGAADPLLLAVARGGARKRGVAREGGGLR